MENNGLMPEENEILDLTVEVWNKFAGLEVQHPSDLDDFYRAIHDIQRIVAMRVLRREYPEVFPTYKG